MAQKYVNILEKLSGSGSWTDTNEAAILEPYTYLTGMPGKEIRGKMITAFNHWLDVPGDRLQIIAKVVGMLHSASLLVDDVEDDSHLRRGIPVAHKIYGIPQTINSANYVYFLALSELHKLTDHSRGEGTKRTRKDLEQIVIDELLNLHRGQGLELLWRDSLTCPTEEEYVEMVNNKTGGLFRIAIKLMMAESESDVDYTPLVNLIGVLFQIRDDYMNLQSDEYTVNKSFAEDLTEGKFSFPIVHAVRTESGRQVLNVLQKRPSTPTMKSYIISHMETETHSFEYVRSVLSILERQAMTEISRLGGNPQLEAIVSLLSVPPAGPQS